LFAFQEQVNRVIRGVVLNGGRQRMEDLYDFLLHFFRRSKRDLVIRRNSDRRCIHCRAELQLESGQDRFTDWLMLLVELARGDRCGAEDGGGGSRRWRWRRRRRWGDDIQGCRGRDYAAAFRLELIVVRRLVNAETREGGDAVHGAYGRLAGQGGATGVCAQYH